MSERLLEAFREAAERATAVPAFEPIEAAGRRRRRRRHAVVGAVAACALAVTGFLAATEGALQSDVGPAHDPRSGATPYPGPQMVTLEAGTYDLTPYADVALPAARITVPDGWNAAQYGPDGFAGVGPAGTGNEKAMRGSAWYAGLRVREVILLNGSNCASVDLIGADTEEVLSVLMAQPRQEVISGPDDLTWLGRPAVHLSLREVRHEPRCELDSMFDLQGRIGKLGLGGRYELWLVDVEDDPLLVVAGWTRNAPDSAVKELLAMADSIELHPRTLPWRE